MISSLCEIVPKLQTLGCTAFFVVYYICGGFMVLLKINIDIAVCKFIVILFISCLTKTIHSFDSEWIMQNVDEKDKVMFIIS